MQKMQADHTHKYMLRRFIHYSVRKYSNPINCVAKYNQKLQTYHVNKDR